MFGTRLPGILRAGTGKRKASCGNASIHGDLRDDSGTIENRRICCPEHIEETVTFT